MNWKPLFTTNINEQCVRKGSVGIYTHQGNQWLRATNDASIQESEREDVWFNTQIPFRALVRKVW
eukprot:scaffold1684_cov214-Amphora_coffeaeformis.AAC.20